MTKKDKNTTKGEKDTSNGGNGLFCKNCGAEVSGETPICWKCSKPIY